MRTKTTFMIYVIQKFTRFTYHPISIFHRCIAFRPCLIMLALMYFGIPNKALGQKFIINQIFINGNEITANKIIERELPFKTSDTITNIEQKIELAKTNLKNTRLFHNIDITYTEHYYLINISVNLSERWYFWPIPILEYADPNLATWLRRQDLDYINYGIILNHKNFAGRGQDLKIKLRRGIREQYAITYSIPQIKSNSNIGLYVDVSLFRQKEIHNQINNYRYEDLLENKYVYHELRAFGGIKWRPGFFAKHAMYGGLRHLKFDKSIDSLFNEPIANKSKYIVLAYTMKYFRGDYIAYPLQGIKIYIKTELGLNNQSYAFSIFQIGYHYPISKSITLSTAADAFISYTNNYPYFVYADPGKTFYMRGFEDYVTHNDFFVVSRYQLKYTLLDRKEFKIDRIKSAKFNTPFLSIFANTFAEVGYTQNIHSLQNQGKTPISYGLGIDFLTYYDWIGRIEVSRNNRNEHYINVHWGYVF